MNVIFCNLCDQNNGKFVDKIVSAADFAMYNSNSKCPQISSYVFQKFQLCLSEFGFFTPTGSVWTWLLRREHQLG